MSGSKRIEYPAALRCVAISRMMALIVIIVCFVGCSPEVDSGSLPRLDATEPSERKAAGSKRMFVTRSTYSGDLKTFGGADSGLSGGDNLCRIAAEAAELGGNWKAWLSSSSEQAIDRIKSSGPWFLVDQRTKVFNNKTNMKTFPLAPLALDEFGRPIAGEFWTGTMHPSRDLGWPSEIVAQRATCNDWTNRLDGKGLVGSASVITEGWTHSSNQMSISKPCIASFHLLCVED